MSRFKMHIMIRFIIAMIQRNMAGYAIGGLSGGEEKDVFWRMVSVCTDMLPREKPCYLMGVGYARVCYTCAYLLYGLTVLDLQWTWWFAAL